MYLSVCVHVCVCVNVHSVFMSIFARVAFEFVCTAAVYVCLSLKECTYKNVNVSELRGKAEVDFQMRDSAAWSLGMLLQYIFASCFFT